MDIQSTLITKINHLMLKTMEIKRLNNLTLTLKSLFLNQLSHLQCNHSPSMADNFKTNLYFMNLTRILTNMGATFIDFSLTLT